MNIRNHKIIYLVIACLFLVAAATVWATKDKEETERPITWEKLPEAVQVTVLEQAGENKITELEQVTVGDQVLFEAEWMEGEMEVEILVAPDGKLVQKEIEEPDDEDDEAAVDEGDQDD